MDESNFYTYKDGRKFELCKKCTTMHINNWEPDTYLWILEKLDVPYIKKEWDVILEKAYQKDPKKITGMSVLGKYLSKMKLKQWKEYGWADSEKIAAEAEEAAKAFGVSEEDMSIYEELYQKGEISEAQYKTYTEMLPEQPEIGISAPPPGTNYGIAEPQPYAEVNIDIDLTQDDITYLALKWGRLYKPEEWVALEQFYNEMMESFDIQGAARIDTLKMICKTSLKMNQAIDCGDIDSYQKLSRVYDSMMKSAKFTEAQNKEEKGEFVDSVGELVALCEKEGFIPRYCTDIPQDKVDKTLQDMNNYTYKLVTQDMGLGQQIEDAIKKIEIQKQMEQETENIDIDMDEESVLEDADYVEYYGEIERQKEIDIDSIGEEDNF